MTIRTAVLTCILFGIGCSPRSAVLPDPTVTLAIRSAPVEVNETAEGSIQGGEVHVYEFAANAGDYIQAVVEQHGLDVVVSIYDSEHEPVRTVSSRERRFGPELAYVITSTTGPHQIRIGTADRAAPAGTYSLVLEAARPATDADRRQMELDAQWYPRTNEMFAHASRGNWDRVQEVFAEWLDLGQTFPPRDGKHRDIGVGVITLARTLWNNSIDRDLAESILNDGIDYQNRTQGPDGYLTATTQRDLAAIYLAGNRPDEAWPLLESALSIMESADDTEPSSVAMTLRSIGDYYRRLNDFPQAIDFVNRALAIYQDEEDSNLGVLLRQEQMVPETQYELGNLYRLAREFDRARPLIEAGTSSDAMRFSDPQVVFERLSTASRLWLELGEYDQLHEVTQRALAIRDRAPSPVNSERLIGVLSRAAEGYLLSGNYLAAETAYRQAIEVERARPVEEQGEPGSVAPMLNYIAGTLVDRGRYRDANAVYREAFEEELANPQSGTFGLRRISRNWSALLSDVGMDESGVAIAGWVEGERALPPPYPDDSSFSAQVEPAGLSRQQIDRRTQDPYRRDLRLLWRDLGAEEWSTGFKCPQCLVTFVSESDDTSVARIWTSRNDSVRYLLLGSAFDPILNTRRLNALGVLDFPMGERRTSVRRLETGEWLRVEAGTGQEWPYDFTVRWYAMTPIGFEPASQYSDVYPDQATAFRALVDDLNQPAWNRRQTALESTAAMPGALESADILNEIVGLLVRENESIDESLRQGMSLFLSNGEVYRNYVASIVSLLMEAGDLSDVSTLEAIATSYYNADSRFSRTLADRGGRALIPIAMELVGSDISQKRWNGLSLLARLHERSDANDLTAQTAATVKRTIADAMTHDDISTRRLAVELLGRIGSPGDLSSLRAIAVSEEPALVAIRETALRAIDAIQSRNP